MKKEKKAPNRQIYVDDDKGVLRRCTVVQNGFIIGNINKEKLVLEMIGNPDFEETIDDLCSGLLHIMFMANDITKGKQKDLIYKKVNQAVGLILDKYDPSMADKKWGGVTDKEIIELENKKLEKAFDTIQQEQS